MNADEAFHRIWQRNLKGAFPEDWMRVPAFAVSPIPSMKGSRMAAASHRGGNRHLSLSGRGGPGLVGKVKEVQKVWLRRVAFGQGRHAKSFLQEVEDRRVVHGDVSH